jgi:hypothetical protein
MMKPMMLGLVAIFFIFGCDEDEQVEDLGPVFPLEVTVPAEGGLIMPSGELLETPDFIASDLVIYSSSPATISAGCPEKITECMPLRLCRPSLASKPDLFTSFDQVCEELPEEGSREGNSIPNISQGSGFVLELNTTTGFAKVWIKEVNGTGKGATVTLVYDLLTE